MGVCVSLVSFSLSWWSFAFKADPLRLGTPCRARMICSLCRSVDDETFGVLLVQFPESLRVSGASLSLLKALLEKKSTSSMRFWARAPLAPDRNAYRQLDLRLQARHPTRIATTSSWT